MERQPPKNRCKVRDENMLTPRTFKTVHVERARAPSLPFYVCVCPSVDLIVYIELCVCVCVYLICEHCRLSVTAECVCGDARSDGSGGWRLADSLSTHTASSVRCACVAVIRSGCTSVHARMVMNNK